MLSFLNQALFGNDNEGNRNSGPGGGGQQQPAWRDLAKFYQENEEILKQCESFDVSWAAKHNKEAELEKSIEAFASSANLIAEGLVRLANVHPVLGVAVSAYHSVLGILLPSAVGHKKVILVMLQIQSIMCTMFQLRSVKYTIRTKAGAEKTPLQSLLIAIATDIVQYGNELYYYMNKDIPYQLLLVNIFEKKIRQQIKTLVTRRNELQSLLSDRSNLGNVRSRTNTAITNIGHMLQQADPKLHNFVTIFFRRIRTSDESEAIKLLEGTKSAPREGTLDAFVKIYAGFFFQFMTVPQISGYTVPMIRKIVNEALTIKWEPDNAPSLPRFKKVIETIDSDSERKLLSRQKAVQRMSQQLHSNVNLLVEVRMATLGGRTTSVDIGPFVNIEDVEMMNFWTKMQFGNTVEIDTFITNYHQYLSTAKDSAWMFESVTITDMTSLSGSLYEPGASTIHKAQANKFALERPEGISLASWIAYWSLGWRLNVMAYRDKIYSTMHKLHQVSDDVHIANTTYVFSYLNSFFFVYIDGLFKSITPTPENNFVNELTEVARLVAKSQEERLLANLNNMSFIIQSPGEVELIGGYERIESFILPLLYILLQRHLAILEIAQKIPIVDTEILVHIQSLDNIFQAFSKRMNYLEAKFKNAQQDVLSQFKTFAHGMFHASFILNPADTRLDISNTLSTFRNLDIPASRIYTLPQSDEDQSKRTLDVSILVKGPGNSPLYHEVDRSIVTSNQKTHELEGGWCADSSLGIMRINIGPIVNNTIEGNAESFTGAYNLTGQFEPVAPANSSEKEKSEKHTTGNLTINLRCERFIANPNAPPLTFKGRYDPTKEVFRGDWEKVGYDVDPGLQGVSYSRISAPDSRFAYYLRNEEDKDKDKSTMGAKTMVDPSWTLARRRWAFATQTVLSQVQVRIGSSKVIQRGLDDRRKWLAVGVFDEAAYQGKEEENLGFVSDQWLFETLEASVPVENGRLYQALAEYLHLRKVFDLGAVCDSCNSTIKHTRFSCITCRSRFSKGHNIDLCTYCLESQNLQPAENDAFVHVASHSLIRTSRRLNHFDEYGMICQARRLSEDIKRSFRGIAAAGADDTAEQETGTSVSLKCACCEKNVTLPCYMCLTCSLHPIFCLECDREGKQIGRNHPSFAIHTRKHPLLRISDSTSVDTDLLYDT